jgi:DNA polymerase-1
MEEKKQKDTLLLIDANSLVHRAFHALPPFSTEDGRPSGALYGLASILIKVFKERPPKYVAAAFDFPKPSFRKREYEEYKSGRASKPSELIEQIKEAHTLIDKFGIKIFEKEGWEADDIINTLAHRNLDKNLQVIMLSGDLDMLQAVRGDDVVAEVPKRGISETAIYNEDAVRERFGIAPKKFADYKGLVGDTSDNIPGVPGVGPKTAKELLKNYDSLEDIYEKTEGVGMTNKKLYEKLMKNKESAIMSKKLAILDENVPITAELEDLKVRRVLTDGTILEYLNGLGFKSLVKRIVDGYNTKK